MFLPSFLYCSKLRETSIGDRKGVRPRYIRLPRPAPALSRGPIRSPRGGFTMMALLVTAAECGSIAAAAECKIREGVMLPEPRQLTRQSSTSQRCRSVATPSDRLIPTARIAFRAAAARKRIGGRGNNHDWKAGAPGPGPCQDEPRRQLDRPADRARRRAWANNVQHRCGGIGSGGIENAPKTEA